MIQHFFNSVKASTAGCRSLSSATRSCLLRVGLPLLFLRVRVINQPVLFLAYRRSDQHIRNVPIMRQSPRQLNSSASAAALFFNFDRPDQSFFHKCLIKILTPLRLTNGALFGDKGSNCYRFTCQALTSSSITKTSSSVQIFSQRSASASTKFNSDVKFF